MRGVLLLLGNGEFVCGAGLVALCLPARALLSCARATLALSRIPSCCSRSTVDHPCPPWPALTLPHPPCFFHAEELPAAADEEPLSLRQLLERRLAHTDQLAALYEGELWALAEELRLRHTQFAAQRGEQTVWKSGEAGTPAGSEAQQQQQQMDEDTEMADADDQPAAQRQQQQKDSATKPLAGEESVAPGAALRALWQERQWLQQGAGDAAHQDEQQQGIEQDVKQPQQGAGKQQAGGKPEGKAGKKGAKAAAAGDKAAAKRSGQAAGKEGGGKAAKAEGKQEAVQDKQQAGAEGASKQPAKQTAGAKQASGKDVPASDSAGQQPAAAGQPGQEGAAAGGTPAEPAAPAVQLPPLPPQPRFEDIEALVLSGAAAGLPPVDEAALVEARARFVRRLDLLGRLEQSALSAAARQLDALGGLALLCGRRCRYILRRSAVAIGRSSGSQGKVRGCWDVQLGRPWVLAASAADLLGFSGLGALARQLRHAMGTARCASRCLRLSTAQPVLREIRLSAVACQPYLSTCLPALHGSKACPLALPEPSPACLLTLSPPSGGC